MNRRAHLIAILGLAAGLLAIFLVWHSPREGELTSPTPISPFVPPISSGPLFPSPLSPPTATPLYSPLPAHPSAPPPIAIATLEAIRTTRPTAMPPSPSDKQLPYISPATWRVLALRFLAAAGVLVFIGLRLRRSQ
jgi:hypothetical protein